MDLPLADVNSPGTLALLCVAIVVLIKVVGDMLLWALSFVVPVPDNLSSAWRLFRKFIRRIDQQARASVVRTFEELRTPHLDGIPGLDRHAMRFICAPLPNSRMRVWE